jgi:valyl-tRNA synthetase
MQLGTTDSVNHFLHTPLETQNGCDQWILNKFNEFSNQVYKHMEKLELTYIPNLIYKFIETLCNTFIKLSRERMKGMTNMNDTIESLHTLYTVQTRFNLLLAPFMPHLAEHFNSMLPYVNDVNESIPRESIPRESIPRESIHLKTIDISVLPVNKKLLEGFCCVNELIENVRNLRQQINKPNYFPINTVELHINAKPQDIMEFSNVICKELNVKELIIKSLELKSVTYIPNKAMLGKLYKKDASKYAELIERGDIAMIDKSCY